MPARAGAEASVQAIDDAYNRQLLQLEQHRLEQLGRLAARQQPAPAAATYERLFRLAIAGDLFRDAEAAAVKVVEQGTPSPTTDALAHLVKIIAEVERGAYRTIAAKPAQGRLPRARRKSRRPKLGQPWPPPRSSESAKPTISAWSKAISSRSPARRSGSSSNSRTILPSRTSSQAV